jgi:hypothetical protein
VVHADRDLMAHNPDFAGDDYNDPDDSYTD